MDKRQLAPLLIWALLALVACSWLVTNVQIRSDLSLFLPASVNPVEKVLQHKLREGVASRLILLGIEGGSLTQRVEASRQLRQALSNLEQFTRVENGVSEQFQPDPLLFEYRYLLSRSDNAHRFTPQVLSQALEKRMQELTALYPSPFKQLLPQDPTATYQTLLMGWLPKSGPARVQGVWFSGDQKRALLIAETRAKGMEIDSQQRAADAIRHHMNRIDGSGQLRLSISGPGVFAVQSREVIRGESKLLSLISSAAIVLILLLAYRSWRITILAALPLATAMLVGSCVTSLLFGELHGITLAFGITLLGVTIDYPIHLFSHLKKDEPASESLMRIWGTLRLGVVTTCIGYLVMAMTEMRGLSQLGVFTISGLLAGALTTRLLLPGLMGQGWEVSVRGEIARLRQPNRWWSMLLMALGLCSILFISFQQTRLWQDDLSSMSVLPEEVLALDREMRAQLNAPEAGHLVALHGTDLESVLQRAEKLQGSLDELVASEAIGGFNLASHYLPSNKSQLQQRAALPSDEQLAASLEQALVGLRFRRDIFDPFLQDVAKARDLPPLGLEQITKTIVGPQLTRLLTREEGEWYLLVPLYGVKDPEAIHRMIAQAGDPSIRYLQIGEEGRQMVTSFREGVFSNIGWGLLAMTALLLFGLKSFRSTVLVLLPVLLAVSLTIAMLALLGEKLTIFHLVALMLVVGIGIDYSLFFGRREENAEDDRRTLHALMVCAISTSTVFLILSSSEIQVLNAIGQTVALGVVASFISCMMLSRYVARDRAGLT